MTDIGGDLPADLLDQLDAAYAHLIGKRVRVTLAKAAPLLITETGILLSVDIGGQAVLDGCDGRQHFVWPVLEIEELHEQVCSACGAALDDAGGAEGAASSPGGRPQDGGIEGLG